MRLEDLFRPHQSIAVLAGAGISLSPPSNLLPGATFMDETLKRIVPKGVDRDWVLSLRSKPVGRFVRPGEFLRFEVLMAGLMGFGLDPDLHVLDCLSACETPNANHQLLAEMIHAGCVIMTTNFDTLIERAYARVALDGWPPLRVVCRDEDFPTIGPLSNDRPTLWKLHGSFDGDGPASRASVQATMMSVMALPLTSRKKLFLEAALGQFDLITLGYSGFDDLDLIPTIAATSSSKKLIWISHRGDATNPEIRDGETLIRSCEVTWAEDVVGWQRILFQADDEGSSSRSYSDVIEVTARTSDVVSVLARNYGIAEHEAVPTTSQYQFGSGFPDAVTQFFDGWLGALPSLKSTAYECVGGIARNRCVRTEDAQRLTHLKSGLTRLRRGWRATAHDQLMELIDLFSEQPRKRSTVLGIQRRLYRLPADLSVRDELTRARLEACVVWTLEGVEAGERAFRHAVNRAREARELHAELSVLIDWRSFGGSSQWSDLYPEFVDPRVRERFGDKEIDRERLASRTLTGERFPDEENRRLLKLADRTGRLQELWALQIDATKEILDERPLVQLALFYQRKRVLQFCIDVGDVSGERTAEWSIARLYMTAGEWPSAALHLLRTLELTRIAGAGDVRPTAEEHLNFCQAHLRRGHVDEMRRVVQRSMWGAEVAGELAGSPA